MIDSNDTGRITTGEIDDFFTKYSAVSVPHHDEAMDTALYPFLRWFVYDTKNETGEWTTLG